MTERMRNSFIEQDSNGSAEWLSKIQPADNLMRMGDGTAMEVGAFSDSVPMMSYSPEELGINMDATPQAVAIAATNPYPYTDRQEVAIDESPKDSLTVVKQDFVDGGVEFASEGDSVIKQAMKEVKDYVKENPLLTLVLGASIGFYLREVLWDKKNLS